MSCEMEFYMFDDRRAQSDTKADFRKDKFSPIKADVYPQIVLMYLFRDASICKTTYNHSIIMPRRRQIKKSKEAKAHRKAAAKNSPNHSSKAVSGATPGAMPKAASRPACYFLRIPLGEKSVGFMCI